MQGWISELKFIGNSSPQQVFIHCKLVAWDPTGLDKTKKACHYDKLHG